MPEGQNALRASAVNASDVPVSGGQRSGLKAKGSGISQFVVDVVYRNPDVNTERAVHCTRRQ